jgi:hypothetical protein
MGKEATMATRSLRYREPEPSGDRPSGVPPPGRIGASRNELRSLLVAVLLLIVIGFAFWLEATH